MVKELEECLLMILYIGVSDSKKILQKLIDVVYSCCSKWRLLTNECV